MPTRLLLSALLACSLARADVLLRGVTIVDVARGAVLPRSSILIRAGKIAAIGVDLAVSKETQVVDGAGKFVIPGLWDMHVHLTGKEQLAAYVAQGVTGIRDMGSEFEQVKQWRAAIQKGALPGPRIETSGPVFDGFPSEDSRVPVNVVRGPGEARAAFDRLDDQGIDFISVFPRLPRDAYFALAERARKYYSFVSGRVPSTVRVWEAIDARQKTIDRMSGILLGCSTEEEKLRQVRTLALERRDREGFQEAEIAAMNSFSPEKAGALFHHMALFETRSVPMLVDLRAAPRDAGLFDMLIRALMLMHRAGVAILAGTGAGEGALRPGESLHQELELLVAAGLTPAEALRTATLEAAKYLDATESLGSIERGKVADLVLLDANPISDIRNTRKIAGVILGGKYLAGLSAVAKSK